MRSGELKKIISIQKQANVADGMGGFTQTWVDIVTGTATATNIWAAIWPTSAKEQIMSEKEVGTITQKIRIRYRTGVTSDMRVKYGSKYFGIVAPPINTGTENRWLDLLCMEVTA